VGPAASTTTTLPSHPTAPERAGGGLGAGGEAIRVVASPGRAMVAGGVLAEARADLAGGGGGGGAGGEAASPPAAAAAAVAVRMPDAMRMGVGVLPSGFSLPVASAGGLVTLDPRLLVAAMRAPRISVARESGGGGRGGGGGGGGESTGRPGLEIPPWRGAAAARPVAAAGTAMAAAGETPASV
jgi:hypothetical protein